MCVSFWLIRMELLKRRQGKNKLRLLYNSTLDLLLWSCLSCFQRKTWPQKYRYANSNTDTAKIICIHSCFDRSTLMFWLNIALEISAFPSQINVIQEKFKQSKTQAIHPLFNIRADHVFISSRNEDSLEIPCYLYGFSVIVSEIRREKHSDTCRGVAASLFIQAISAQSGFYTWLQ